MQRNIQKEVEITAQRDSHFFSRSTKRTPPHPLHLHDASLHSNPIQFTLKDIIISGVWILSASPCLSRALLNKTQTSQTSAIFPSSQWIFQGSRERGRLKAIRLQQQGVTPVQEKSGKKGGRQQPSQEPTIKNSLPTDPARIKVLVLYLTPLLLRGMSGGWFNSAWITLCFFFSSLLPLRPEKNNQRCKVVFAGLSKWQI